MKTRFPIKPITICGIAALITAPHASAQAGQYEVGQHEAGASAFALNLGNRHKWVVTCGRGLSLSKTLERAAPGSTIVIRGACYENVTITTDDLTIEGTGGAIISGAGASPAQDGVVKIVGAKRVVLRDLSIVNGADQGVIVEKGASAKLSNLHLTGHGTTGLSVDASYAEVENIKADNNGAGVDFFTGASVIATGPVSTSNNGGSGVSVNGNSTFELRGSILTANGNAGDGVTLVNDADLLILSFPESQGSGVVAKNNGGAAGLFVANSSIAVVGSQFTGSGANVFTVENNGVGMLFIASNFSVPFATAKFNISNNGAGIILTDNSDAFLVGGLNVSGNFGPGIIADGAGVVRLNPNGSNPSTIQANGGPDILASFGTRIDLQPGVAFNVFVCTDASVVTPPTGAACP